MTQSHRVSRTPGSAAAPLPTPPPRPNEKTEPPVERVRVRSSVLPWLFTGGLAAFLLLLMIAFGLLYVRSRQRIAEVQAEAEVARLHAQVAAAESARLQMVAEQNAQGAQVERDQLRQLLAQAQTDAAAAKQRAKTIEADERLKRAELEAQLAATKRPASPTGPTVDDETLLTIKKLQQELLAARRTIDDLRARPVPMPGGDLKPPKDDPGVKPGTRPDPGDLSEFAANLGKSYLFTVTGSNTGTIYGSNPYTTDSTLATAAVHAGVLKNGETGVVQVTIQGPGKFFRASLRYGVVSNAWDAFPTTYKVSKKE